MELTILSGGRGGWHVERLQQAATARGHRVRVLAFDAMVAVVGDEARFRAAGRPLEESDAVLVRLFPRGSLEQVVFRLDVLHALTRAGRVVVNSPACIERTVDKLYTSLLLREAGIPTPRTVVAERAEDALVAFREMRDVIVKPLFGSNGRGMVRVTEEEIAHRVFRALDMERAVYYVQETVPHPGRDLRVFVVGDRVLAAAWRTADHWCTNVSRGGRTDAAAVPPAWQTLCLRAARAVGADYAGVDLLPTPDGDAVVLEVNGIPGWEGLQRTTGEDVAGAIVEHVAAVARGDAPAGALPGRPETA